MPSMVITMQIRYLPIFSAVLLSGCVVVPAWKADMHERVPVNTPALTADLQAVRSAGEFRTLQNRYARSVSLTVAKALELYVPADYAVFPDAGIDLARSLLLDRSRTWSDALPAALRNAGIEARIDAVNKTIQLAPAKETVAALES